MLALPTILLSLRYSVLSIESLGLPVILTARLIMSGGPGGGTPDCAYIDYSGQFFVPQGADIYHVGDTISLSVSKLLN